MVILRVTSILGGQKEDKGKMCSITLLIINLEFLPLIESIEKDRKR
jgi:hypothetical protein